MLAAQRAAWAPRASKRTRSATLPNFAPALTLALALAPDPAPAPDLAPARARALALTPALSPALTPASPHPSPQPSPRAAQAHQQRDIHAKRDQTSYERKEAEWHANDITTAKGGDVQGGNIDNWLAKQSNN